MKVRGVFTVEDNHYSLDIEDDNGQLVQKGAQFPLHQFRKGTEHSTIFSGIVFVLIPKTTYNIDKVFRFRIVCTNQYIKV